MDEEHGYYWVVYGEGGAPQIGWCDGMGKWSLTGLAGTVSQDAIEQVVSEKLPAPQRPYL